MSGEAGGSVVATPPRSRVQVIDLDQDAEIVDTPWADVPVLCGLSDVFGDVNFEIVDDGDDGDSLEVLPWDCDYEAEQYDIAESDGSGAEQGGKPDHQQYLAGMESEVVAQSRAVSWRVVDVGQDAPCCGPCDDAGEIMLHALWWCRLCSTVHRQRGGDSDSGTGGEWQACSARPPGEEA